MFHLLSFASRLGFGRHALVAEDLLEQRLDRANKRVGLLDGGSVFFCKLQATSKSSELLFTNLHIWSATYTPSTNIA